ncbi:fatty acid-binding protein, muscle-like [Pollicipes pollicipes]|uniref:fatty acid-binding protein, muscle-like n=1 Tax=Pollicipes pollicipes TaxID=41117 RepID=UPI0018853913|nr:fatty acid-binding protein, muscle-like [Pollicipes pollicipes]XP_037087967.1 fatty acid-binding protein, muscle-like [Pollicipes pollicipes]
MVQFAGSYQFVSADNDEALLTALGVAAAKRKIVLNLKPEVNVSVDGDHWTISTASAIHSSKREFDLGQPHQFTAQDGRAVTGTVTKEGNKLVETQRHEQGLDLEITREFTDSQMIMTSKVGDVVSVRVHQRK